MAGGRCLESLGFVGSRLKLPETRQQNLIHYTLNHRVRVGRLSKGNMQKKHFGTERLIAQVIKDCKQPKHILNSFEW